MNTLQLAGILLAGIGAFALTVQILEKRHKRATAHRLKLVARLYWPSPPPALPRPPNAQEQARYRRPPRSSELLPWR